MPIMYFVIQFLPYFSHNICGVVNQGILVVVDILPEGRSLLMCFQDAEFLPSLANFTTHF